MIKLLIPSFTLFALLLSSGAMASSTAMIKVQAILMMGSCTPSLDNGGLLDFGSFPVDHLYEDTPSGLDSRTINLHITCTEPVALAYTFQDDRSDTLDGGSSEIASYGFGIGKTATGINIGHFYLYLAGSDAPIVNGAPAQTIYSDDNGAQWDVASSSTRASNSGSNLVSFSDTKDFTHPLTIETAVTELAIHPIVQSRKTLALTDDQPYEGMATISLIYL
ncbi:DUF1120 domain-containing protein [Buttiauxella sp. WJP83]|uniref:DUF1120 domain-containing protein n=1 Tax=Buttiauxella sp. WJP83 TaxID=2986951 RepID=UPI0022DCFB71|nr:DUF1120 domain-containing protein [Buttiauxella sp. WJP83]WBM68766.1 DUF1120 domain-containing protein [Buttiauxella sp. WJP83]